LAVATPWKFESSPGHHSSEKTEPLARFFRFCTTPFLIKSHLTPTNPHGERKAKGRPKAASA
ncbi:hypothetical protein, partial [Stutzerimonas nitrititolerans]|uniref:hypothetical protein n=1 Tax=Stutzerimonas nitrititolerans TaxID=2482751 RepID=UPI0028A734A3